MRHEGAIGPWPGARKLVPVVVLATALLVASAPGRAGPDLVERAKSGAYSAAGLYDPLVVEYDNGLTLVARQRRGVPAVSVRVSVRVGSAHYECGQQHVPHFLEHMLFGAVPGIPEAELERRFFEMGAEPNARTEDIRTVYELDVFRDNVFEGLDLVADMLTRAELTRPSFENTKRIIWRESGGEPGPVQLQSLPGGRLASGVTEAIADVSPRYFGGCSEWDGGQDVKLRSVQRTYDRFYVPQRMVWIVVGDFDFGELRTWADRRLKPLPRGKSDGPADPGFSGFDEQGYSGFHWEPGITLLALTDGYAGDAFYARWFLSHLLDETLYKRLRIDTALTYTPDAWQWNSLEGGLFALSAESKEGDHDEALRIIREIVAELTAEPLDPEEFRAVQLSVLQDSAQSVETNADYAEHYVSSLFELRRAGEFTNDQLKLAQLTAERVHRVAERLFAPGNMVVIRDADREARIDARDGDGE